MRKKLERWLERYRCMDWAVLYMRLFAGAMMLFHNIGKMQNYNELIGSYPSFFYLDPSVVFVIASVAEVLLSVSIILGLWVRLSALLMAMGILTAFVWGGFGAGQTAFVWLGIYVFLIISGGGLYGFNELLFSSRRRN